MNYSKYWMFAVIVDETVIPLCSTDFKLKISEENLFSFKFCQKGPNKLTPVCKDRKLTSSRGLGRLNGKVAGDSLADQTSMIDGSDCQAVGYIINQDKT